VTKTINTQSTVLTQKIDAALAEKTRQAVGCRGTWDVSPWHLPWHLLPLPFARMVIVKALNGGASASTVKNFRFI